MLGIHLNTNIPAQHELYYKMLYLAVGFKHFSPISPRSLRSNIVTSSFEPLWPGAGCYGAVYRGELKVGYLIFVEHIKQKDGAFAYLLIGGASHMQVIFAVHFCWNSSLMSLSIITFLQLSEKERIRGATISLSFKTQLWTIHLQKMKPSFISFITWIPGLAILTFRNPMNSETPHLQDGSDVAIKVGLFADRTNWSPHQPRFTFLIDHLVKPVIWFYMVKMFIFCRKRHLSMDHFHSCSSCKKTPVKTGCWGHWLERSDGQRWMSSGAIRAFLVEIYYVNTAYHRIYAGIMFGNV